MRVRPLLGALLASCLVLSACGKVGPDQTQVAFHCKLIDKRETEERRYCGKACTRSVYDYYYTCPTVIIVKDI